jgi:hypothetical protein
MELIMSGEFGRMFFALGTAIVVSIVWFGYYRNVYVSRLTWGVVVVFILYVSTFLLYRYTTGHMEGHMAYQPMYVVLAALHGTISLAAILLACYMFVSAGKSFAQNQNYFTVHPILSLLLVTLWPLALLSGFLI